jgi:secreted trypsin-like serine protease
LFGITSFGFGCGDIGAYTRVSAYADWISNKIAGK